jgi:hypothetical protein
MAERVTRLLAEYGAADPARREAVAAELAAASEEALPHLIHALDSPAPALQAAATRVLARQRDEKVAALLLDYARRRGLLDDPSAEPETFDVLSAPPPVDVGFTLLDGDADDRNMAIGALRAAYDRFHLEPGELAALRRLGYRRPAALSPDAREIVEGLRERLRAPELKRRLPAIEAAAALRAEPLLPDLADCLGVEGAQEAAHTALREITKQDLPPDPAAWTKWMHERMATTVQPF